MSKFKIITITCIAFLSLLLNSCTGDCYRGDELATLEINNVRISSKNPDVLEFRTEGFFPTVYGPDCSIINCVTDISEDRLIKIVVNVFAKSRLPGSQERLIKTFDYGDIPLLIDSPIGQTFSFDPGGRESHSSWQKYFDVERLPFTDYRVVVSGTSPYCRGEGFGRWSAEATFSEDLIGLVDLDYHPNFFYNTQFGLNTSYEFSSVPRIAINDAELPLNFQLIDNLPQGWNEQISINSSDGYIILREGHKLRSSYEFRDGVLADTAYLGVRVTDNTGRSQNFNNAVGIIFEDENDFWYQPNRIEINHTDTNGSVQSTAPIVDTGSTFRGDARLISVFPKAGEPFITVDRETGIVTATGLPQAGIGEYKVSVFGGVTFGNGSFDGYYNFNALTFAVVNNTGGNLPTNLVYDPNTHTETTTTNAISSPRPTVQGDTPLTFSIANANSLPSPIQIDPNTGIISATNILALEFGEATYAIDVTVTNSAGSVTFPAAYTIIIDLP